MKKILLLFTFLFIVCTGKMISQNLPQRLYVIDKSIQGYQEFSSALVSGGKILVLPETGNPLDQIRIALTGNKYDEVHIYTNVKTGSVVFNSLALTSDELSAQSSLLNNFKSLVSPSGKIIIHGNPGDAWINKLKLLTGIEVVSE
jgi:hypothetical protein